ncbi:acyltransferase family protein [Tessaracoccus sp. MC1627]|nr:acyltransferase family protein [Tessaracoccus sp. MC1627]MBB1513462.1 acyltransferase family protein [Tessaracoccus sp. MC1627]
MARGLAIIGVVVGHALRGLFAAGLADPAQPVWAFMDRALYLLHLPVFAFATGLLMPRPVERDGQARYLRERLSLLLYLFLLWTLIEGTAEVLTSSVKNVPVTWVEVLSIWTPLGPLWFLPLLMLATVVVVVLAPWRGPVCQGWVRPAVHSKSARQG